MHQWRWPESAVMRHTRFFDKLLYELVKILDTDEFLSSPSRLIRSIFRAGMKTWLIIGLFRWSEGGCSATPTTLRLLVTCSFRSVGPLWWWRRYSGVLENHDMGKEVIVQVFHLSRSRVACSRSCSACSRLQSNRACSFANSSFMSANIWRSWAS